MRQITLLAAALLLAACGAHGPEVKVAPGADLLRYRRVGVLPLSVAQGDGKQQARYLEEALGRLGLSVVDAVRMSEVFDSLRLKRGEELSLHQLVDIRSATQAEAMVTGAIEPAKSKKRRPRLVVLMIDGQSGDLVGRASLEIPPDELGGLPGACDAALSLIRQEINRQQVEQGDLPLKF